MINESGTKIEETEGKEKKLAYVVGDEVGSYRDGDFVPVSGGRPSPEPSGKCVPVIAWHHSDDDVMYDEDGNALDYTETTTLLESTKWVIATTNEYDVDTVFDRYKMNRLASEFWLGSIEYATNKYPSGVPHPEEEIRWTRFYADDNDHVCIDETSSAMKSTMPYRYLIEISEDFSTADFYEIDWDDPYTESSSLSGSTLVYNLTNALKKASSVEFLVKTLSDNRTYTTSLISCSSSSSGGCFAFQYCYDGTVDKKLITIFFTGGSNTVRKIEQTFT